MEFFHRLGTLTGRFWHERGYRLADFPAAAMRALTELPPNQHVTLSDAVRWALLEDPLPRQHDMAGAFGQPPLTVYHWGRDFRIELLFWVTGVPVIHQHAFSGAFHVLHGSSLHTEWAFEDEGTWPGAIRGGAGRRRR